MKEWERMYSPSFSHRPETSANVFSGETIVCFSRITRAKKSEANAEASHNRGMNVRPYFSSKFNLPRPYSPYCYILLYISRQWIVRAKFRTAGHYIFTKQSIYKFNRAMHCNWIRGVARQRRGVGNEYTFPFFSTGLPGARPFPPYSFSEKTESGQKRIKMMAPR